MTDIYLSYSEPNLALAQDLKKDVESCSSLSVALEDHDWEETDDCDFQEHIASAKMFILIVTEHSNITAWVIDHNNDDRRRRRSIMKPPTLDFSSYKEGMLMLKYVLRVVIGTRRFQKKRSSTMAINSNFLKHDKKPLMPASRPTRLDENSQDQKQEESSTTFPRRSKPVNETIAKVVPTRRLYQ